MPGVQLARELLIVAADIRPQVESAVGCAHLERIRQQRQDPGELLAVQVAIAGGVRVIVSALLTALAALLILRMLLPAIAAYDSALLGCALALIGAIGVLLFSFSARALRSTLALLPERLARSRAAEFLERLHDA